jgi:Flp pilus assembly protein TadD
VIVDLKQRLLDQARAAMTADRYDLAIPMLERLARVARGDRETVKFAQVSIAAHYFEQGDLRAVEHFRAALALNPKDDRVLYCLGHAHLDGDQFAEAASVFASALEVKPGDPEYLRSLGVALAESGRIEEALTALKAAAKVQPDEPFVLKDLAQVLAAKGRYDEAVKLMRRAVALAPDEHFFREVLEELMHQWDVTRLARSAGRRKRE